MKHNLKIIFLIVVAVSFLAVVYAQDRSQYTKEQIQEQISQEKQLIRELAKMFLVDALPELVKEDPTLAEQALVKADITLNKNMVPFDDKSAFVTSGIRIGTPAITTRGLKEEHMQFVVNCVDNVIMNADDENVITTVRKQVNEFMHQFSLYPELG